MWFITIAKQKNWILLSQELSQTLLTKFMRLSCLRKMSIMSKIHELNHTVVVSSSPTIIRKQPNNQNFLLFSKAKRSDSNRQNIFEPT